jgi:phosphoglucosamine mutase
LQHHADYGIALDGDGDRLMMVDRDGRVYDGDQLIYVIAKARMARGELKGGVVGTVMTNLGMEMALSRQGIPFGRARVGDRYVLEMLSAQEWMLGGEASGHILCLDKHNTGDGIISALQVLNSMRELSSDLATMCADWQPYPQTLINVRLNGQDWQAASREAMQNAELALKGHGRVVLRPSGTEPVVRVMVEADELSLADQWAQTIARAIAG